MRSIRRYQFFRHASDVALDHMRRLADLVIAAVLLVITFPLIIAVALAIKWEGPGPIFERQACIGRGRSRFQSLKFRTMALESDRTAPVWARKQLGSANSFAILGSSPCLNSSNGLRGEMSVIDPDGSSPSFPE